MRDAFRTVAALRSAFPRVKTSCSSTLPCATNWAYSLVRIDAFAHLTACSGYACDGCGLGGGKRCCWLSRPQSRVGIAKGFEDAGAGAGATDAPEPDRTFRPVDRLHTTVCAVPE